MKVFEQVSRRIECLGMSQLFAALEIEALFQHLVTDRDASDIIDQMLTSNEAQTETQAKIVDCSSLRTAEEVFNQII